MNVVNARRERISRILTSGIRLLIRQMDFGDQIGIDIDFGILVFVVQYLSKTALVLVEKSLKIETLVSRWIFLKVTPASEVDFLRAADIAVAKVVQRHSYLNQALIVLAGIAPVFGP